MDDVNFQIVPFTRSRIEDVLIFIESHLRFYSMTREMLEEGLFEGGVQKPSIALLLISSSNQVIMGVIAGTLKLNKLSYPISTIKLFLIHSLHRNQGLGSKLFTAFINHLRKLKLSKVKLQFDALPPEYWNPGVDFRHTDLMFFLQHFGFHTGKWRNNLSFDIPSNYEKPKAIKNEIRFQILSQKQISSLEDFIQKHFRFYNWIEEIRLSYRNNPMSTVIALDNEGQIVGWACFNISFPGCFGPTGVQKKLRGKGIGSELLKWCIYQLSQQKVQKMIIRWVSNSTAEYYSKSIGAHISAKYLPMWKKIKL